jgi:organic hydroperoxide reductase OsmC/OhrA
VIEYTDSYSGTLTIENGTGKITEVTLNPIVTISSESDEALALDLHHKANEKCFIANSVNFPVKHSVGIKKA